MVAERATTGRSPLVIAHRGASGYLPEHTLEAKALAYGQGADYLEQDVVASRDGRLFVLHDIQLDRTTDVAQRHPERCRADGRWYAIDFDARELRALRVTERLTRDGGAARYPQRFPVHTGNFRLHTLDEELEFIRGLNRATGGDVGIYPELKSPAWHLAQGIDLGADVLACLERFDYMREGERVWLQCFDPGELRRLRESGYTLPMVQLVAPMPEEQGEWPAVPALSDEGLAALSETVQAVGPWLGHVLHDGDDTGFTARAHAAGLEVHPWTLRRDELPAGVQSFDALLDTLFGGIGVDGVFTDFPDLACAARARSVAAG